jgi:hypothetical protein
MNNNETHQRYRACLNEMRLRSEDDPVLAKIALEREVLETAYEPREPEEWTYRDAVLHAARLHRIVEIERECQQKHGISNGSFHAQLQRDLAGGLFPVACYRRLGRRAAQTAPRPSLSSQ